MTIKEIPKAKGKGVNSIIILVAWELWKHRNNCASNALNPAVDVPLQLISIVFYVECCRSKWVQGVVTGLKPLVYSSICELGFLVGQSVYPLVYFLSFLINITCNPLAVEKKIARLKHYTDDGFLHYCSSHSSRTVSMMKILKVIITA